MTIQTGDKLPSNEFSVMGENGPEKLSSTALFSGKRVVLFAVPGAFTPTCSAAHLPGFIRLADQLKSNGVDDIACVSVNDVFVMDAWSKHSGAENIKMLADGNADFTRAIGLTLDASMFGMGTRSKRYAMIIEDGVVQHLAVDEAGLEHSAAEAILAVLETAQP
ncbi:MAG: peroxiredoxin [Pseudomonadales bacterium]|nr:peroxiredoxin [Pseudomonadales bacterium]